MMPRDGEPVRPQPPTLSVLAPVRECPGMQIGSYKLLERMGEGGFGVVFLAEQETPVVRRVALKIIKLGMDTREVVARFEQERQALALMDHPNIAKVLDAGSTEAGRPYFVMELVRGESITTYCDRHCLATSERLQLFAEVCHAVQHAHQKGIIHRDLKPSNVLVALLDGRPVPKVIDFGVAKATHARLTEKTLFTVQGQLIGTPEYMSPEQAEAGGVDIDTRTDIYSLGVLLYELLTGTTPFDAKQLRAAGYAEIQRIIREVEPQKPSTRLATLDETSSKVAAQRHSQPGKLALVVRGDLDWIVLKCLEKDRTRRYETANGLALDVQRHLHGQPVIAAPPSTTYKLRKFVRRHRAGVLAGGAFGAVLILGVIGTTAGMFWALREKERVHLAEQEATRRASELEQVSEFQSKMLAQVDPTRAGVLLSEDLMERFAAALAEAGVPEPDRPARIESFAAELRIVNATDAALGFIDRTILEPAIETIDADFADQPLVQAKLQQVVADRYRELGLYDASLPLQERALATRSRMLGGDDPELSVSINNLGLLLHCLGKLDEAEPLLLDALDRLRRKPGDSDYRTLVCMNNVARLLHDQGKLDEAERCYREVVGKFRSVLGEEHPDTLTAISNMAVLLQAQGKLPEAEQYAREALDKRRSVLGEEHSDTLMSLNNVGGVLMAQQKFAEAEPYFREIQQKFRRVLGEENPFTLIAILNLGGLLFEQGKFADVEPCFLEVMEKRRRTLGDAHPDTLRSYRALVKLYEAWDKAAPATGKAEQAAEWRARMDQPERRITR